MQQTELSVYIAE